MRGVVNKISSFKKKLERFRGTIPCLIHIHEGLALFPSRKGYEVRVGVRVHQEGDTVPRVTRQEVPDSSGF